MALRIDWESAEKNKPLQITILMERYNIVCEDLIKEKRALKHCSNVKEIGRNQYKINQLTKKKEGYKRVLFEKYGIKTETRGRPALPPDKKAENNQTKLTVRLKKENAEYIASLKKDNLIDTYSQFFDLLITAFRQQSRQG